MPRASRQLPEKTLTISLSFRPTVVQNAPVLRVGGPLRTRGTVAGGYAARVRVCSGEGSVMKAIARSLVVIFVALIAVPALAVSYTMTAAVQLLAVTGLYMGGTEHPLSHPARYGGVHQRVHGPCGTTITLFPLPRGAGQPRRRGLPGGVLPGIGSTTFDDSVDVGRSNLNRLHPADSPATAGSCTAAPGARSTSSATRRVQ